MLVIVSVRETCPAVPRARPREVRYYRGDRNYFLRLFSNGERSAAAAAATNSAGRAALNCVPSSTIGRVYLRALFRENDAFSRGDGKEVGGGAGNIFEPRHRESFALVHIDFRVPVAFRARQSRRRLILSGAPSIFGVTSVKFHRECR